MIVSKMKPPYEITSLILKLITSISEKIGEVNAYLLNKSSPKLRKQNRIKTIHSSLKIEGNTLTEEQITALFEKKQTLLKVFIAYVRLKTSTWSLFYITNLFNSLLVKEIEGDFPLMENLTFSS
jgi:Fic family protein